MQIHRSSSRGSGEDRLLLFLGLVVAVCGLMLSATRIKAVEVGASRTEAPQVSATRPTVVFMTDFGLSNDAVPICKGVMWSIAPDLRIVDLTHEVTPYSVLDGARFLAGVTPYYGPGTVFVVVIDPTVGSTRKAVVVKSKRGQYFVLPDNGLITLVQDRDGIEGAREITNAAWMLGKAISSTFHGRDIFSPVGAHLARREDWTQVGPELQELVRLNIRHAKLDAAGVSGEIIALDTPFGSLISNIEGDDFGELGYRLGEQVHVMLGRNQIVVPYVRTFSDVPMASPLLYIDSRGHLGLAVNQGSFSRIYKVKPPLEIFVPRKTTDR